jgi:hypothetical protein
MIKIQTAHRVTAHVVRLGNGNISAAEFAKQAASPGQFTKDGELLQPKNYRAWVYVGAPLTPNDMNEGAAAFPEFHSVYIDPASYEHYQRTGQWREGTMFVKELISVGSKQSPSGFGYFMGEFIGLEAMVKSRERFPNEPGNWSFYSFTSLNKEPLKKQVGASLTAACNACHGASAREDHVFTQYYPVLRAARAAQENPENR